MQKQLSNNEISDDKYSIYSKSGRKLYRRINNNIRVLNKSKLSSRSNHSIGSVALRRTQLSNDKIYSRQQQFIPINSSQVGLDFQSVYQKVNSKQSIPMSPNPSSSNNRQRMKQSLSQRSLRADSHRSDAKINSKYNKVNKQDIQKYFLLQTDKKAKIQNYKNQSSNFKRSYKQNPRSSKQSIRSSLNKQQRQEDYNPIKSIRSIKSSLKSPQSKNYIERKQYEKYQGQNDRYKMKKISQKYLQPNKSHQKSDRMQYQRKQKDQKKYRKQSENSYRQFKVGRYQQQSSNNKRQQSSSRKRYVDQDKYRQKIGKQDLLQKYQSQKQLHSNQYDPYSKYMKNGRKKDKYYQDNSINKQYQRYYLQKNNARNIKKYQNPTQYTDKYQTNSRQKYDNADNSIQQQKTVKKRYVKNQEQSDSRKRSINNQQQRQRTYRKQNRSPQRNKTNDYKSYQRSSILDLRSRHNRSNMRNIKIRQSQYSNLYQTDYESQVNYKSKRQSDTNYNQHQSSKNNSRKLNSPRNHQYYKHLNKKSPYNDGYYQNQRKTQISQTFDSLMLSINSRVTSNSSNSIQNIIQKIKLHLNTLQLISDYTQEFKKMYEQIDLWEELIFLAYKKYWVQRVKVLNYVKKFRKSKRHQSQRITSSSTKRNILGYKVPTMKNIASQNYKKQFDNAFDEIDLCQNPFSIPFCKISQQQIKQLSKTQEGLVLLQKIQKQNQNCYKTLQQMYNFIIAKSGNHINMIYCDNFSDDIYILMLEEIQQLIPNLQQFAVFQVTKIRLGKIVKAGILILFLNGKYIRNIAEIITYDDLQKIGIKKKIKTFTTYDLYYQVFQSSVAD